MPIRHFFCSISISFKCWNFQSHITKVMAKDKKVNIAVTQLGGGGVHRLFFNCQCFNFSRKMSEFPGFKLEKILRFIYMSDFSAILHCVLNSPWPLSHLSMRCFKDPWKVSRLTSKLHRKIARVNVLLLSSFNCCNLSSIMHIQVQCAPEFHNYFGQKKLFLFFNYNFTRIDHCKFIHHKSHLKLFLAYLPCREYFSIIFNVKKCTLYSIKTVFFSLYQPSSPIQQTG